jgi:hypothetical protein
MKKFFLPLLLCILQFCVAFRSSAQTETAGKETPSWTCDKGYWVVVSNRHSPKEAAVYYYTNDHIIVYKEEIKNKKLKLNQTGTLMRLKQSLEVALASYENGSKAAREQGLTLQR